MKNSTNMKNHHNKHRHNSLSSYLSPEADNDNFGMLLIRDINSLHQKGLFKETDNHSYHSSSDNSLFYKTYLDNLRKENKYHSNKHNSKDKGKKVAVIDAFSNERIGFSSHVGNHTHGLNASLFKQDQEMSSIDPKGLERRLNHPNRSSGNILKKKSKMKRKSPTPQLKSEKRLKIKEELPPFVRNNLLGPQVKSESSKHQFPTPGNKISEKRYSHYQIPKLNNELNSNNASVNHSSSVRSNKNKKCYSRQKADNNFLYFNSENEQKPKMVDNNNNIAHKESKVVLYEKNSESLNKPNDASNKENYKNNALKHEKEEKQPQSIISSIKPKKHFFFCCIPIN